MKLTKQQSKLHKQAEEILQKDKLTFDEKIFVMTHWQEGATNNNSSVGAFFTPIELAKDVSLCTGGANKMIDLCAGIGNLSFFSFHHMAVKNIICVELNADYVRVGKKILPEAIWIQADVLDKEIADFLIKENADFVVSNPPFGNIKTSNSDKWLEYDGNSFEYKVINVARKLANYGVFIIPQISAGFKLSGNRGGYMNTRSVQYDNFVKNTGIKIGSALAIDTEVYIKQWKGVTPMCEIVEFQEEEY